MDIEYFLRFYTTKGVGEKTIKKVINYLDQYPEMSWQKICMDKHILVNELHLKNEIADKIINSAVDESDNMIDKIRKNNIEIILENDKRYPAILKTKLKSDCPAVLFACGNLNLLEKKSVGFCGSRKASAKGITIAEECAQQFAKENIVVTSGYAAGVDISAHSAALQNGGSTIFVLAEGILSYRVKKELHGLLNDKNYLFLSQFSPEMIWNAGNAMKRNSLIIGLSEAMILIESGKKGGTFAAGQEALNIGCPLFVVDYDKPEVSAEANPYFIANGGRPIRKKAGKPNLEVVLEKIFTATDKNEEHMKQEPISTKIFAQQTLALG